VRPLNSGEAHAYDEYVSRHPAGLVYYCIAYRDLITDYLRCEHSYLVAADDARIRGVLPVMWREVGGRRVYNSLPFFGSHGGVLADGPEAEDALCSAWEEMAGDERTLSATVIENPLRPMRRAPRHVLTDDRISQITPLPAADEAHGCSPEDAVLERVDSSARRNARKAARAGITVEAGISGIDARLEVLAAMHADNLRRLGGAVKRPEFFATIRRHFAPGLDFNVYLARIDRRPAAALLVFTVGDTVEYFTPTVDSGYRSLQPLAAVLLRAMTDAVRRGFRRWNWGGTHLGHTGVYRFKRKWGATESRYRYFVDLREESVLDDTPQELLDRFGDFYVVPFAALRSEGGHASHDRS
jgi:GNAT acetyltransferase-like protein